MVHLDILKKHELGRKIAITLTGLLAIIFLGVTDFLTGTYLAFSIFYLIPVMMATWFAGLAPGISISIAAAIAWFTCDQLDPPNYPHFLIPYWNAFVRLSFFLICAYMLSAVKKGFEKEKTLSRTDALTGVENSRAFFETADKEIERMRRHRAPFSIVYIDVDNFKKVNDTLGHSAGDKLLAVVADTMKEELRSLDVVARLGGDEFAILLPETDQSGAAQVVGKMKDNLDATMNLNRWSVTFSIGVVSFTHPPGSVNEMIKEADALMYEVKNNGKNSIKIKCH